MHTSAWRVRRSLDGVFSISRNGSLNLRFPQEKSRALSTCTQSRSTAGRGTRANLWCICWILPRPGAQSASLWMPLLWGNISIRIWVLKNCRAPLMYPCSSILTPDQNCQLAQSMLLIKLRLIVHSDAGAVHGRVSFLWFGLQ